jgi:hypothetical protein
MALIVPVGCATNPRILPINGANRGRPVAASIPISHQT